MTKIVDERYDEVRLVSLVRQLRLAATPFDEDLAYAAGQLRAPTRRLDLSLGDRACRALAVRQGAPALTADRAWRSLDLGIEIRLVR